jgi:anti-sigma-K factor RskA
MAEPARSIAPTADHDDEPPLDPDAIDRAYRRHRARRAAKQQRTRERRWAHVRFWVLIAIAIAVALLLAARTLGEIQRVFGL